MSATRTRKPSSKARRKKRRVVLTLGTDGQAPTIVCARTDGVESWAHAGAGGVGLARAGFVPSGTRNPGEAFLATPTQHPSQALKWNVRGSDATILITAEACIFGRARLARSWCGRYRKPWLHLHPGSFDPDQVRLWLRTRPLKSVHITGARAHQGVELQALVEALMSLLGEDGKAR
jgi:hypothetical protein